MAEEKISLEERTTIGFPKKLNLDETMNMLQFVARRTKCRFSGGTNGFYNISEKGEVEAYPSNVSGMIHSSKAGYAFFPYEISRAEPSESGKKTLSIFRMNTVEYEDLEEVPKEKLDLLDEVASEINMWFGLQGAS